MNLQTLKSEKEKVEKGCGKHIQGYFGNCGEEPNTGMHLKYYCPTCKARLEIYNKAIRAVENTIMRFIELYDIGLIKRLGDR